MSGDTSMAALRELLEKATRPRRFFDFKITIGTILSMVLIAATWYGGYEVLKQRVETLETRYEAHVKEDRARFAALESKETNAAYQKALQDKLQDIISRLDRIERLHMRK